MKDDIEERDGGTIRVGRYEPDESVSVSVGETLAELRDTDPASIDLHDYVDVEALDRLFEPLRDGTPRTGRVSFQAAGYDVTVRSDGTYTIGPVDE